ECAYKVRERVRRSTVHEPDHRHRRLLRAHRERPRGSRAAQCEYEFSPSDVDCHATPPAGGRVHAIEGTISPFSEGTNNALRCESLEPPMSQLGQTRPIWPRLHACERPQLSESRHCLRALASDASCHKRSLIEHEARPRNAVSRTATNASHAVCRRG